MRYKDIKLKKNQKYILYLQDIEEDFQTYLFELTQNMGKVRTAYGIDHIKVGGKVEPDQYGYVELKTKNSIIPVDDYYYDMLQTVEDHPYWPSHNELSTGNIMYLLESGTGYAGNIGKIKLKAVESFEKEPKAPKDTGIKFPFSLEGFDLNTILLVLLIFIILLILISLGGTIKALMPVRELEPATN